VHITLFEPSTSTSGLVGRDLASRQTVEPVAGAALCESNLILTTVGIDAPGHNLVRVPADAVTLAPDNDNGTLDRHGLQWWRFVLCRTCGIEPDTSSRFAREYRSNRPLPHR
jgi:hypothetical protein